MFENCYYIRLAKADSLVCCTKLEFLFSSVIQIQKSVSARMEYTTVLEQDTMEGVDADEWNE